jgi:heme-degrading monooxygenase HmoA
MTPPAHNSGQLLTARSRKERHVRSVNSGQTTTEKLADLVTWAEEQPAFCETPGFRGLSLLADRQSGKVVTISSWDSEDDLRQNNEARGAQVREASSELGIAPTLVDIYEVVLQT